MLEADQRGIDRAADILACRGLVALPTETVYGLSARADSDAAVRAIFAAKGRPSFNPLIVHVANAEQAARFAVFNDVARSLAAKFWPGALTIVLPKRDNAGLADAVTAGLPTVALRCPADPVMRATLAQCNFPLAAPSANRSGAVSPTTAAHVADSLGDAVDAIVDGGPCRAGIESTIVAVRDDGSWQILRPGPVMREDLANVLGADREVTAAPVSIEAPGQLESHYAPGKPVRLNARQAEADEFLIGFAQFAGDYNLSPCGNLGQAGRNLYAALHAAAASDKLRIAVVGIPDEGMGVAINDRLRRAAA